MSPQNVSTVRDGANLRITGSLSNLARELQGVIESSGKLLSESQRDYANQMVDRIRHYTEQIRQTIEHDCLEPRERRSSLEWNMDSIDNALRALLNQFDHLPGCVGQILFEPMDHECGINVCRCRK